MDVISAGLGRLEIGSVLKRSIGLVIHRFPLYLGIATIPALFLVVIGVGIAIFGASPQVPAIDPGFSGSV